MKIIKIGAIWCGGCLVMAKTWESLKKNYSDIEFIELDYDIDDEEVKKHDVGEVLPVFIFYKDGVEVKRINGEVKESILVDTIEAIK